MIKYIVFRIIAILLCVCRIRSAPVQSSLLWKLSAPRENIGGGAVINEVGEPVIAFIGGDDDALFDQTRKRALGRATNAIDVFLPLRPELGLFKFQLQERVNFARVISANGGFYVGGAINEMFTSDAVQIVEYFNATDGTVRKVGELQPSRYDVVPAKLKESIYWMGGYQDGTGKMNSVNIYNTQTEQWTTDQLPLARTYESACVLFDEVIVAQAAGIIGHEMDLFINGAWHTITPPDIDLATMACAGHKGQIYLLGGKDGFYDNFNVYMMEISKEDDTFVVGNFTVVGELSKARYKSSVATLGDHIVFAGGDNTQYSFDPAATYDTMLVLSTEPPYSIETISMTNPSTASGIASISYKNTAYLAVAGGYKLSAVPVDQSGFLEEIDTDIVTLYKYAREIMPSCTLTCEGVEACIQDDVCAPGTTSVQNTFYALAQPTEKPTMGPDPTIEDTLIIYPNGVNVLINSLFLLCIATLVHLIAN